MRIFRVKNDAVLSLRIRQDKMSRVENDADLLLKVRRDKTTTEKMMQTCC